MRNSLLISLGKTTAAVSKVLNKGNGSTWPGHIALTANKNFIKHILKNSKTKIIFVAGTNGKTTTASLINTLLTQAGYKTFQNNSGANLLNGIASTMLLHSSLSGTLNYDFGIFEIDENTLPLAIQEATPDYMILLNLFRDQLDRYGEVNTIAAKWKAALSNLPKTSSIILNADDPQIAYLGNNLSDKTYYFGLDDKKLDQKQLSDAVDSIYCPNCGNKLTYTTIYFSHLGIWSCSKCKEKRPKITLDTATYPLPGTYNRYNTLAAVLTAQQIGIEKSMIEKGLKNFSPAFGRQELIRKNGRMFQIFLSKNPTSFNESLRTVTQLGAKYLLLVLNDRIPDGRDVSWIWDVDFEKFLTDTMHIRVSGDRAYDMALRLKYAHPAVKHIDTHSLLDRAFPDIVKSIPEGETLYILPTYSAMLEVRKLLTGKKIL